MYGVASGSKRSVIEEYGATPIDYRTQDFVEVVRRAAPGGIDVIFDGMDGADLWRAGGLLRRGGRYIGYGNPLGLGQMLGLLGRLALFNLAPNGKSAIWYSTGVSLFNRQKYLDDWARLFEMLGAGQIRPVITKTFPLLEAAQANRLLESGQVIGSVVLVAPDGGSGLV
jgi:NADPH:quinone reductase-like Zn-dependent oxidoreductase